MRSSTLYLLIITFQSEKVLSVIDQMLSVKLLFIIRSVNFIQAIPLIIVLCV